MGIKLGIDLGSMYSCVCGISDNGIHIISNAEGMTSTLSAVYFDPETDEIDIGEPAWLKGIIHPECLVMNVKELLNEPSFTIASINGKEYSAIDIYSIILQKLVLDTQEYTLNEIDCVVLTYPAYFSSVGHSSLIHVFNKVKTLNGEHLPVQRCISSLEAIAFAYIEHYKGYDKSPSKTVLIYDLGASFETAVLELRPDSDPHIISYRGSTDNYAWEWTQAISYCAFSKCFDLSQIDESINISDSDNCWNNYKIELAKRQLSRGKAASIPLSFDNKVMTVEITPEDLHDAAMLLLERTFMLTDDVIHAAKSSQNKEIDEIILVGGGSKMLRVKEHLESRYNKPVNVFEPEFAVAKGAALFANRLE